MNGIRFEEFSCFYKNKKEFHPALNRISMEIQQGEFLVVVGESGSGKTTLLKSILGLCEYIEGNLYIDDVSIDDYSAAKENVGYVSQEIILYPNLTVYENIAFPLRQMHTPQHEVDVRVKTIAQQLEIDYLLTRLPRHLSGGQHQRVALARALIKNPQMLLLDEPFSNLEPDLRKNLRQYVKKLHESYDNTTIYVTHDLEEAWTIADRILILDNGCVTALGTPDELQSSESFRLLEGIT